MTTRTIEFADHKPVKYSLPRTMMLEGRLEGNTRLAVGIDPGVNFGLTVINLEYVQVIYGKLPRRLERGHHGLDAYDTIEQFFMSDVDTFWTSMGFKAVVEGAAFHKAHGQVGLEEVRFGFFLALHQLGFDVKIVPPATIRKAAFGGGREQGGDVWPWMNSNGADSVGCALYALGMYEDA